MNQWDIGLIKDANEKSGQSFFGKSEMKWFRSRVLEKVYEGAGGIYFVTSERQTHLDRTLSPRRYTIRRFYPDGNIDTIGEFNKLSRRWAQEKAERLANGEKFDD